MHIDKLLTITGVFKGNANPTYQYYQIIATDEEGKTYMMTVGCKVIQQESCEKTFSRLILISAPTAEQVIEMSKEAEEAETTKPIKGETNEIHLVKS